MAPHRIALVSAAFLALAAPASAEQTVSYQSLMTPLFSGNQTVLGQTIAYPEGTPQITSAIVMLPPGGETKWHTHEVPLFAYILEGEITIDYGSKGVKVYKPGDAVLEAIDWPHNGTNKGTVPVRLLAVYIGAEGKANAASAAGGE